MTPQVSWEGEQNEAGQMQAGIPPVPFSQAAVAAECKQKPGLPPAPLRLGEAGGDRVGVGVRTRMF